MYKLLKRFVPRTIYGRTGPLGIRKFSTKFNSGKLLEAVSELSMYGIHLNKFPSMVFIGPQSTGKTSLVEAIINASGLFPVDMKMATKTPMHITTLKSDNASYQVGDKEYYRLSDAAQEISRLNENVNVRQINIVVRSPNLCNTIFYDLPGLFSTTDSSDDPEISNRFKKEVKNMVGNFLSKKNIVPVVVHSAPSDPATNAALKFLYRNHRAEDAIGVITKVDLLEGQNTSYLQKMLNDEAYKLGHGYCAVVLLNDMDKQNGMTIEDKKEFEKKYFAQHTHFKKAGVPTLCSMISDILAQKISENIPTIVKNIDDKIESLQHSKNFLHGIIDGNNTNLSRNLEIMAEKLVTSAPERAEFEQQLKQRFGKDIRTHLSDHLAKQPVIIEPSDKLVDNHIIKYLKNKHITDENFGDLFSYGHTTTIFLDNETLRRYYGNEQYLAFMSEFIEPYVNDNLGVKRRQWIKQLMVCFDKLLKDETIHHIIKNNTIQLLCQYITDDPYLNESDKKFVEYIINEIGNEIFESKIKYCISAIINLEKRPIIHQRDIQKYLYDNYRHVFGIERGLFGHTAHKKRLEIFGQLWNEANINLAIGNMIDNCYRNVAVNLIDVILKEIVQRIIDMFRKEYATKQRDEMSKKIKKLQEIREILTGNVAPVNDENC